MWPSLHSVSEEDPTPSLCCLLWFSLEKPWPSPCMLLKLIQYPLLRSMHRKFSHVNKHSTKRIYKNSAIQRHSIIETCWYLLQQSACHQTFGCLQHTPTQMHTVANVVTCLTQSFSLNWWLDFRMNGLKNVYICKTFDTHYNLLWRKCCLNYIPHYCKSQV